MMRVPAVCVLAALVAVACAGDDDRTPSFTATIASETATPAPATAAATSAPPGTPTATHGPGDDVEPALVLSRGDASRRTVALTFDAGSDAGSTTGILATLRREGVRGSFGVTGLWAEANRELMLAIAADGHVLINHSYSPVSFTGASPGTRPLSQAERASELSRTETTIFRMTGRSTRPFFRPPFGDYDDGVRADAAAAGYGVLAMWTVDTFGWRGATVDEIVARSIELAAPGAIYILHVGSDSQDGAALPRIISALRAEGYAFATIDEMLER
jgi:peptidoglycan/xylan/chitin deacetylase (PgdA/CDA1 family)